MKLGYLGPKGTFSFEAAKIYSIESDCTLEEYRTIIEAIDALKDKKIDEAIVPIENSIQGGVTETIDSLIENDKIYVNNEIILTINHNLMANKKYNLSEIREIYSHPQAIAQCRKYIETNLKKAIINQVSSTALAAKEIAKKDYCACIANLSCLEEYGLELLKENIQDNSSNKTKFWVLSRTSKEQGNKMSLIFSTKDIPGALYQVLGIFYKAKINLTKIESRPAKTEFGEYIFLVELEAENVSDEFLKILNQECKYLKILGRY